VGKVRYFLFDVLSLVAQRVYKVQFCEHLLHTDYPRNAISLGSESVGFVFESRRMPNGLKPRYLVKC